MLSATGSKSTVWLSSARFASLFHWLLYHSCAGFSLERRPLAGLRALRPSEKESAIPVT